MSSSDEESRRLVKSIIQRKHRASRQTHDFSSSDSDDSELVMSRASNSKTPKKKRYQPPSQSKTKDKDCSHDGNKALPTPMSEDSDNGIIHSFKPGPRSKTKNEHYNHEGNKAPPPLCLDYLSDQLYQSDSDYSVSRSYFSSSMSDTSTDSSAIYYLDDTDTDTDAESDIEEVNINAHEVLDGNAPHVIIRDVPGDVPPQNTKSRHILSSLTNHRPQSKSKLMSGFWDSAVFYYK